LIRFFTPTQFEDILRKRFGLEKTSLEAEIFTFWKLPNGKYVQVPKLEPGYTTYTSFDLNYVQEAIKQLDNQP